MILLKCCTQYASKFFFKKSVVFVCLFNFFICSGFCHTLKWNSHGFTCVPHPDPPSHLPNLWNSAVATGLERSVFIPIPKKGNAKKCSNYHTIALISHTSKVLLNFLQARLQWWRQKSLFHGNIYWITIVQLSGLTQRPETKQKSTQMV